MAQLDREGSRDIFEEIRPDLYPHLKGFIKTNIENWYNIVTSLSPGEASCLQAFGSFITREDMLARIGTEGDEGVTGRAGLGLDSIESKEERYQILQGLELAEANTAD